MRRKDVDRDANKVIGQGHAEKRGYETEQNLRSRTLNNMQILQTHLG